MASSASRAPFLLVAAAMAATPSVADAKSRRTQGTSETPAAAATPSPTSSPTLKPVVAKKATRGKTKEPPPPAFPAPSVTLTVAAPSADVSWSMRVENTGQVPLRLNADPHLLSFELTPPGAKKSVRCDLPGSMRPSGDDQRTIVLPPGRAYSEKLDPRLFCFGPRASTALVAGTTVLARMGWKAGKTLNPPYVVMPIDGLEPAVAAAKEIVAAPVTIGEAALTTPKPPAPHSLALHTQSSADVEVPRDLTLTVTVANDGTSASTFLLRPDTLTFEVTGPTGVGITDPSPTIVCAPSASPATSVRDVFSTLGPRQRTSMTVLLRDLCPPGSFDLAGIYLVHPKLDTRNASGSGLGLRTFDGELPSDNVTRVRIRRNAPDATPSPRPQLEDARTAH